MPTCHVLCAGPSAKPWIDKINWQKKHVFLVNGMPLLFNRNAKVVRWVMVDAIQDGLKEWAGGLSDITRYCTDLNKRDVLGGIVIRHNKIHVMDNPEVKGFYWTGSVGHAACHLAQWLGYTKCLVWGLDYHNKQRSYTDLHESFKPEKDIWDMMSIEEGWHKLRTGLRDFGCDVFNCNPDSDLKELIKVDPNEAALED